MDRRKDELSEKHDASALSDNLAETQNVDEKTPPQINRDNAWDNLTNLVRYHSPAIVVNESARLNYGLKVVADSLSIKSGLRPAILNNEALHRPFYEQNPGKLPKGFTKYVQGMRLGVSAPDRAIAGFITLSALGLGTIFGEKPMTKEQREAYKEMPVSEYIPMRIRHAFQPWNHSTSTVGLATIANGLFMSKSGFKQWNGFKAGKFTWKSLPWEAIQGLMTVAAGSALQFIPDQERAWQISHGIFVWRAPVAATQAWRAWEHGIPGKVDPGDWEQGAKWVLNQSSNLVALFYGGVRKENGQIVFLKDGNETPKKDMIAQDYGAESIADIPYVLDQKNDKAPPSPSITTPPAEKERIAEAPNVAQATG